MIFNKNSIIKYYLLPVIIFIGTSSPITGMSRTNKVLSQLVIHCIKLDEIKTIISEDQLEQIKQFYLNTPVTETIKRFGNFLDSIAQNKEAYFKACETDTSMRYSVISTFVIPFLLEDNDVLYNLIQEFGETFVTKTLPQWMNKNGKPVMDKVGVHSKSYVTFCLYCICDLRDIPKLKKLLISGLCPLNTLDLAPLAPWAKKLIRFWKLPFMKELTEKRLPGIENLITLHIERPKLQLAKRPDLCTYIADPDSVYNAYIQKNSWKRDYYLQTVLMWACMLGQEEHVRTLLSYPFSRAWINLTDIFEIAALEYAVRKGNVTIIKLLLAAGAQPHLRTLLAVGENNQTTFIPMLIKTAKEQAQKRCLPSFTKKQQPER